MSTDLVAKFLLVELSILDGNTHPLDLVDVLSKKLIKLFAHWGISLYHVRSSRVLNKVSLHLLNEAGTHY